MRENSNKTVGRILLHISTKSLGRVYLHEFVSYWLYKITLDGRSAVEML